MIHDQSLLNLWQSDDMVVTPLPIEEIKRRANRLGDVVHKRNRLEYIASGIVALAFAIYAVILPTMLLKLGSVMMIIGIAVVVWQLARRTSRPDAATIDVRAYYRIRLVTEEHMLSRVVRWYLAPLVPGLAVFMAGQAAISRYDGPVGFALFAGAPALLFGGIWLLNRHAAAMLRRQIDRLDQSAAPIEGNVE